MGDVNHNPGCECLSCHVARGRMLRRVCEQEVAPIAPSGDLYRQLTEVTKKANKAWAYHELTVPSARPLLNLMMANIERQAKKIRDEIANHTFSEDREPEVDLFYPAKDCDDCQRVERDLIAIIAAKDARIAELKSELARRPAAFVDPDEKPEHNSFREFIKDRRMMGP